MQRPGLARRGALAAGLAVIAALVGCTFTTSSGTSSLESPNGNGSGSGEARPPVVVQLYSPPLYRAFVSRSVPYRSLAEKTRAAALPSTVRVREEDPLFDDHYERSGTIVMLGVEDGAMVGFTTRYSVDIRYPDDDLIRDGAGKPDFRDARLTLAPPGKRCAARGRRWCSLEYTLIQAPQGRIQSPRPSTVYFRTFGDNDAVLLYFPMQLAERLPEASIQPLDIVRPTEEVARILSDATEILGTEFVLISPMSLKLLRQKAHENSVIATYAPEVLSWAAGLFGASKVVQALMSKGMGYFAMDRRKLQAALTFKLVADAGAQALITDFDFIGSIAPSNDGQTHLPPLHLAEVPYQHAEDAAAFMQQIVGKADVQLVLFGRDARSARAGMLFVPARNVNLNYELVRSGLARVPTDEASRAALRSFPEFAEAARQALAEGAGFAAEWRDDTAYADALARAR